MEPRLKM